MTTAIIQNLRPDNKGRICISSLIEQGVDSFRAYTDKKHRIILEPMAQIPARELWLYQNKPAKESLQKGLKQAAKKQTKSLGSFAKYLKD